MRAYQAVQTYKERSPKGLTRRDLQQSFFTLL